MNKLLFIALIFLLYSCKVYELEPAMLKKQFTLSDTLTSVNHKGKRSYVAAPDTLLCVDSYGQRHPVKAKGKHLIVKYDKPGDEYLPEYIELRPDRIFVMDSSLYSLEPLKGYESVTHNVLFLKYVKDICLNKQKENRFSIKTTPISLINIVDDPSARLGLEVNLYRTISLYLEGGTYFSYRKSNLNSGASGYLLNPELRIYTNREGESEGTYISFDYRYKNRSFNWNDTVYEVINGKAGSYHNKDYRIHTVTHSFKLKIGSVLVADPFLLDWFIGAGVKFRNTTSGLTSDEEAHIKGKDEYSTFYMYKSRRGQFISPDLMIGIRIGFCFK